MNVIGYVRVSTSEQSIAAQRAAIISECERRDWQLIALHEDTGLSGSIGWTDRPGLSAAVAAIEAGAANVLVCAKLDRLSRSLLDFAGLLERARKKRWSITLLDFGLDMTTPVGEMVAGILAAVAQFERRRIGERTKEGLAQKRAQGVTLGRRSTVDSATLADIIYLREYGHSYQAIADALNFDHTPTPQGGTKWRDTSVRAVYRAAKRDATP